MSSQALLRLPVLQPDSNVTTCRHEMSGIRVSSRLIRQHGSGGIRGTYTPSSSELYHSQKLFTLSANRRDFMHELNLSLKGGRTPHPILMLALGSATSFLFSAATAVLELYSTDVYVLARTGDEIWFVEQIGRVEQRRRIRGDQWVAMHVSSFFLYDPLRANSNGIKGWLIHEERTELTLD